jgi:hypothetical protein
MGIVARNLCLKKTRTFEVLVRQMSSVPPLPSFPQRDITAAVGSGGSATRTRYVSRRQPWMPERPLC